MYLIYLLGIYLRFTHFTISINLTIAYKSKIIGIGKKKSKNYQSFPNE